MTPSDACVAMVTCTVNWRRNTAAILPRIRTDCRAPVTLGSPTRARKGFQPFSRAAEQGDVCGNAGHTARILDTIWRGRKRGGASPSPRAVIRRKQFTPKTSCTNTRCALRSSAVTRCGNGVGPRPDDCLNVRRRRSPRPVSYGLDQTWGRAQTGCIVLLISPF